MTAPKRGFLAYATANDRFGHAQDRANFARMLTIPSGVECIDIGIAISEARPRSRRDERDFRDMARSLEASGRFHVAAMEFKPNVGRDFSSWRDLLYGFRREASPADFVLLLNRSAYGPMQADWYARYLAPFSRHPKLAVCGSSINFEYRRQALAGANTHAQTYAWMSRFDALDRLLDDFPGCHTRSREEAIRDGELGLSRRWFDLGLSITSLAWPGEYFDAERRHDPTLPQHNLSEHLRGVPFRHWEQHERWRARLTPAPYLRRLLAPEFGREN